MKDINFLIFKDFFRIFVIFYEFIWIYLELKGLKIRLKIMLTWLGIATWRHVHTPSHDICVRRCVRTCAHVSTYMSVCACVCVISGLSIFFRI